MARQHGTIWLDGKASGMVFYKTKYGNMARSAWTLSKERLANDPTLVRRRNAMSEFGSSSRVGKLMRHALKQCCKFAEVGPTNHQLASLLVRAVKEDKTNKPGKRRLTGDNVHMLEGFRWREDAGLDGVLRKECVVQLDAVNGQASLSVTGLVPDRDLVLAESATHLQLTLVIARVDYEKDKHFEAFERSAMLDISSKAAMDVSLNAALAGGSGEVIFVGVGYHVMQEVNGQMAGLVQGSGFEVSEAAVV